MLCAGLEDAQLDALTERLKSSLDDATVTRFRGEIDEARKTGYAVDREELLPGLMCVGTSVVGHDGMTIAAISVAGPTFRMEDSFEQHAKTLAGAATELSAELGYVGVPLGSTKRGS